MSTQVTALPRNSLFRHVDFMKFWTGQTVSILGSSITGVALPLVAVIVLNANAVQMGWLSSLYVLPALLFGLFAGAWIDRIPRRPVMIWSDIGRAVILGMIPLAMVLGRLTMGLMYIVVFISAALTDVFDIANRSFLPSLVGKDHLLEGNSKMSTSNSAASVVGPGLGGWLVQLISAPFAILMDSFSFVISALSIAWIRTAEAPLPVQEASRPNIWREVREGLHVIYQNKFLLTIAGSGSTHNFFMGIWITLYDLYMVRNLHFSPVIIGLVTAANAPGGLIASLVADRFSEHAGLGRTIIVSLLLLDLSGLLVLVSGGPAWFIIAAQMLAGFLSGFFFVIFQVNIISLSQAITPSNLLGRVNASMRFISRGIMPLAPLVAGGLSTWLGIWPAIAVGTLGGLLSFLWLVFSPVRSLKAIPDSTG